MTATEKSVKEIYDESILEIQKIFGSIKSTREQRDVAKQTLKDLTAMLLAHTIKKVEDRTALLSGLIVELNQVIESVKVKPPYTGTVDGLTKIADKALGLLSQEKKKLI